MGLLQNMRILEKFQNSKKNYFFG